MTKIKNEDIKQKRRYRKYRKVGKGARHPKDSREYTGPRKWKKKVKGIKTELIIVDCGHITSGYKTVNKKTNESMCLKCYRKSNKSKVKNYEPSKWGTLSLICGYLGCFFLIMTAIIFFGAYFSLIDMENLYLFFDMIHIDLRIESYNIPSFFLLFDMLFPSLAIIFGWKQSRKQLEDESWYNIIGKMSPATLGIRMGIYTWKYLIIYWFGISIFVWLMDILPKIYVIGGIIFIIVFSIIEKIYHEYTHLVVLKIQKRERNDKTKLSKL